jgi:hypothetical protein
VKPWEQSSIGLLSWLREDLVSITEIIREGIERMQVVEFRYKGSFRSAEPHTLGYSRRGMLTLCAWQLTGGSGEAWRDFHVELMQDVTLKSEHFDGPRPGYNPCPTTLTNLICTI